MSATLRMLRRKQKCPGAAWLYLTVCAGALDGQPRESCQGSRNPSLPSAQPSPASQGHPGSAPGCSNLLLMLPTPFCNHCPGQLVKPKRDDPAFIGRVFTHCQLQDAVLQSVQPLWYLTQAAVWLLTCWSCLHLSWLFLVCIWFVSRYTLLISHGIF